VSLVGESLAALLELLLSGLHGSSEYKASQAARLADIDRQRARRAREQRGEAKGGADTSGEGKPGASEPARDSRAGS
jgi:hypothetical protein